MALALAALTFDPGTRYVLVDHAGAWKAGQLEPLEAVLADMPPDSVLVTIVRGKALKQLCKAVEKAGGEIREYAAPKPWELPKWVAGRGRELGLAIDSDTAKQLVALVGAGQQRLSRELEKIALAIHPRTDVTAAELGARRPHAAPRSTTWPALVAAPARLARVARSRAHGIAWAFLSRWSPLREVPRPARSTRLPTPGGEVPESATLLAIRPWPSPRRPSSAGPRLRVRDWDRPPCGGSVPLEGTRRLARTGPVHN